MYDYLSGRLVERAPDEVVLDVGGVGYQLLVSGQTLGRLPVAGGAPPPVTLFVHDLARDERTVLYGFASRQERALFLKLLTVSRVGPGTALALLSALDPGTLAAAVESGDARTLARVKGVGQRLAERLVVELKGRLAEFAGTLPGRVTDQRAAVASALVALGFQRAAAEQASEASCAAGSPGDSLEALVKRALRSVGAAPGAAGQRG